MYMDISTNTNFLRRLFYEHKYIDVHLTSHFAIANTLDLFF